MDLKSLARLGARQRLIELDQERTALLRAFPDLNHSPAPPRPRGTLSDVQRKAISKRMRKIWAARKANARDQRQTR